MEDKNVIGINKEPLIVGKINKFINKYYNSTYEEKFLNLSIIKYVLNNKIYKYLDGGFKKNFDNITKFLGWLSIIGGVLLILSTISGLLLILDFFGSGYLIRSIISLLGDLLYSLFIIISGIGLVYHKKWLPFITIVGFIASAILYAINVFGGIGLMFASVLFSIIISTLLWLLVHIVVITLIVNNKEKFNKK